MSFRIEDILKDNSPNSKTIRYQSEYLNDVLQKDTYRKNKIYYNTHFQEDNSYLKSYAYNKFSYVSTPDYQTERLRQPCQHSQYYSNNYTTYQAILCNYQHMSHPRKGGQIRFTSNQTEVLEKQFNSHKYLSPEDRKQLADVLRLSDRQVKTWFQNRRAKWRRNNQINDTRKQEEIRNVCSLSRKNNYMY